MADTDGEPVRRALSLWPAAAALLLAVLALALTAPRPHREGVAGVPSPREAPTPAPPQPVLPPGQLSR